MLPLSETGAEVSWDPENPYREIDEANRVTGNKETPSKKDVSDMTPSEKEVARVEAEIGLPIESEPITDKFTARPEMNEILSALKTM